MAGKAAGSSIEGRRDNYSRKTKPRANKSGTRRKSQNPQYSEPQFHASFSQACHFPFWNDLDQ